MQHIMRASASTSIPVIEEMLAQPCQQGGTAHACLDSFKGCPGAVRNWRLLWWSMPRSRRNECLIELFHRFPNDYVFLGRKVCKVAFMHLVGCGAQLLVDLRQAAKRGTCARTSVAEWKMAAGICNSSKPKRYLDAAQWIQCYAETHGEMSPMSGLILLPAGRKQLYYTQYLYERSLQCLAHIDGKPAEHKTFLKAWQVECFWVQVAKSESQFTKCGVCEFLRGLLDSTPRSNTHLLEVVRARLGKHWAFQSAQRLAMARIEETCVQSAGDEWPGPVKPFCFGNVVSALLFSCLWEFFAILIGCHGFRPDTRHNSMCLLVLRGFHATNTFLSPLFNGFRFFRPARLCKIDKMDQKKTVLPTIWSLPAT